MELNIEELKARGLELIKHVWHFNNHRVFPEDLEMFGFLQPDRDWLERWARSECGRTGAIRITFYRVGKTETEDTFLYTYNHRG